LYAKEKGKDPEAALDKAYLERIDATAQLKNFLRMLDEV
jgi:hypothetical protein